jgi:hypothetical protein
MSFFAGVNWTAGVTIAIILITSEHCSAFGFPAGTKFKKY